MSWTMWLAFLAAALVPQFIVPDRPQWPQFAIIGATMVAVDMMVMSCYALLATRCRPLLRNPRLLRLQNRLFGGLFVGAGAMLASSSRRTSPRRPHAAFAPAGAPTRDGKRAGSCRSGGSRERCGSMPGPCRRATAWVQRADAVSAVVKVDRLVRIICT
ncbi:LysE family transporter [Thauera sp.]|jgi:hypothetical protein|uniref:LysE family transporter n=1 Tax=Thauera sp. TaxID=1905334 RepID=UPI00262834AB|nr:LysE family transporter [Thauera sp.]MCK6408649.1 hypothetical protein [Thauera sp.]